MASTRFGLFGRGLGGFGEGTQGLFARGLLGGVAATVAATGKYAPEWGSALRDVADAHAVGYASEWAGALRDITDAGIG